MPQSSDELHSFWHQFSYVILAYFGIVFLLDVFFESYVGSVHNFFSPTLDFILPKLVLENNYEVLNRYSYILGVEFSESLIQVREIYQILFLFGITISCPIVLSRFQELLKNQIFYSEWWHGVIYLFATVLSVWWLFFHSDPVLILKNPDRLYLVPGGLLSKSLALITAACGLWFGFLLSYFLIAQIVKLRRF